MKANPESPRVVRRWRRAADVVFLLALGAPAGSGVNAAATDLEWVTPAVRAPGLERRTFESAAAGTRVSYHILVPEAYGAEEGLRFPVLYWLHGGGGSDGRAVVGGIAPMAARFGGAMRGGQIAPMLVVFPNGMHSLWLDSRDGRIPMETVLIKELVPHIDATFRTIASREGRIVEGFSMGGYGAAHLGFKYPEVFGSVSILSGGPLQREFDEAPRVGPRGRERVMGGIFGDDPEYFRSESPWVLAGRNADALRERTLIRVVIGDRDEMLANVRDFSSRLSSLRIPHGHVELPGVGHDPVAVLDALGEENWRFYHAAVGAGGARAAPGEPRTGQGKSSSSGGTTTVPKIENFRLDGERWTCAADGEPLGGILMKPEGEGPFAGIVLSHGLGGNAQAIAMARGREMVRWGFACIATDYTHAGQGTRGQAGKRGGPGGIDFSKAGARPENIRRALACVEILRQRAFVDPRRIAAYGHSMGAFVTIALAAEAPDKVAAAAITAGGVIPVNAPPAAAPTVEVAARVRVPFLILHGSEDTTVPAERSAWLQRELDDHGVPCDRHVFEGVGHNLPNDRAEEVNRLMRDWFLRRGVLREAAGQRPAAQGE